MSEQTTGDSLASVPSRSVGDSVPALSSDDEAAYRLGSEVRALAATQPEGWIDRCVELALNENHAFPRGEARIALQLAPASGVVAAMLPPLTSDNKRLRRRAMTLLPKIDPEELVRQMGIWLPSATRQGRRTACVVLAAIGDEAEPLLRRLVQDEDPTLRRRAERALAVLADRRAGRMSQQAPLSESAQRPFGLHPPVGGMPARPRSFAVAAFNFSYGVNLGTLIRSAEAAGAEAVWIVGRDFYYRPSTKGTDWWLPVEVVETPAACIERARAEGYQIVALQQGPKAQSLFEAEWPEHPLIVVGNEGDGLRLDLAEAADLEIEIPVYGKIDSLNVSMAASVAMYAFRAFRAGRSGREAARD
jgi:tRNA G18 (ribose-2'-O)-methylase SpoU